MEPMEELPPLDDDRDPNVSDDGARVMGAVVGSGRAEEGGGPSAFIVLRIGRELAGRSGRSGGGGVASMITLGGDIVRV